MIVRAEGYQSVTQYIRVAQESASFEIVMDAVADVEESSVPPDPSASPDPSSSPDPVTDYYKVYIDAPEGVEVYLDGNYVGVSPCSFPKSEGAHVLILRKEGYETRSYTLQIDDAEKDMSYSFADLRRQRQVRSRMQTPRRPRSLIPLRPLIPTDPVPALSLILLRLRIPPDPVPARKPVPPRSGRLCLCLMKACSWFLRSLILPLICRCCKAFYALRVNLRLT